MKIVLQRVSRASVTVKGEVIASTSKGLLILFGAKNMTMTTRFSFLLRNRLILGFFLMKKAR